MFSHDLARAAADVAQFQAVYSAKRTESPRTWANQTPYPFLESLKKDEVEDFAQELSLYALDAAQSGTLENFEGNLRAWKSTAEIYNDPNMLAEMVAPINPEKIEEVFAPAPDTH